MWAFEVRSWAWLWPVVVVVFIGAVVEVVPVPLPEGSRIVVWSWNVGRADIIAVTCLNSVLCCKDCSVVSLVYVGVRLVTRNKPRMWGKLFYLKSFKIFVSSAAEICFWTIWPLLLTYSNSCLQWFTFLKLERHTRKMRTKKENVLETRPFIGVFSEHAFAEDRISSSIINSDVLRKQIWCCSVLKNCCVPNGMHRCLR